MKAETSVPQLLKFGSTLVELLSHHEDMPWALAYPKLSGGQGSLPSICCPASWKHQLNLGFDGRAWLHVEIFFVPRIWLLHFSAPCWVSLGPSSSKSLHSDKRCRSQQRVASCRSRVSAPDALWIPSFRGFIEASVEAWLIKWLASGD